MNKFAGKWGVTGIAFGAMAVMLLGAVSPKGFSKEEPKPKLSEAVEVADMYYWSKSEGNLGCSITGKFHSLDHMVETLALKKEVGLFKSKKYPFNKTKWILADILVSIRFTGQTASWSVSGPKPLIQEYVNQLEQRYKDKSLFYDFGYSTINFQPSKD